ncbi:MAG: hypothetical protein HC798_03720, partial [Polaribacter sp.]|nr:hypothetical protein [Polaribacter sp.]
MFINKLFYICDVFINYFMKSTNQFIVKALHVVVYFIFILLAIEAGSLIINFLTTVFKPEWAGNLHDKLNLSILLSENNWAFYSVFSFILFLAILKCYLFYIVINLMQNFDIENPFNKIVATQITKIAYYTFSIGIISHIAKETSKNLMY